ncbi:NERD domain-containing protein [Bacillus sp. 03113]|uniref:NERD domain-containing protein n=1 Tax=Bacillus sp. 03113 TaxID=2578211 RepID=UPI00114182CB|nr:NERD domain-containing protein [Bacillus sp. 03113]
MAQIIKLMDYVSRYEHNILLYPSRFIRSKKKRWGEVLSEWDSRNEIEDLKRQFLDHIYLLQLKWASSTINKKSFLDHQLYKDERLKYILQRFPDTYLVLYHPIFLIKKAPVEGEMILITPTEVCCITFLEEEDSAVYVGSTERFWVKKHQKKVQKTLNPILAVDRTEKIIKNIFSFYDIDLPIHKIILTRNGYMDYPLAPIDLVIIDKRNYDQWFQEMRNARAPLKHIQLKAAQALLRNCQSTSIRRVE